MPTARAALPLVLLGLVTDLAVARAEPPPPAPRPAPAAAAPRRPAPRRAAPAPRPARTLIFDEGDQIDGARQLPDGTTLFGIRDPHRGSLIRLRGDFLPEIVRAIDEL